MFLGSLQSKDQLYSHEEGNKVGWKHSSLVESLMRKMCLAIPGSFMI